VFSDYFKVGVDTASAQRDRLIADLKASQDPDRQDEGIDEARWAEFQRALQRRAPTAEHWSELAAKVTRVHRGEFGVFWIGDDDIKRRDNVLSKTVLTFADEYGWPAVYTALGRAMRESGEK
jgi:hypothetical protein